MKSHLKTALIIAGVCSLPIVLGAASCDQTTSSGPPLVTSVQITSKVDQALSAISKGCGFVAQAQAIADIFASGIPAYATVSAVASAVCSTVKRFSATPNVTGTYGSVAGVPVVGYFKPR